MDRRDSESTLDYFPSEKSDALPDDLNRVDEATGVRGAEYDLENQASSFGKSLTRADTAAWVTKHPSRIPDEGKNPLFADPLTVFSRSKEGIDIHRGI